MLNLTAIPACGVPCLVAGLPHSSCSLSNETCLCADQEYNKYVETCVMASCTVKDQLLTLRESSLSCGVPVTDTAGALVLLNSVLFATHSVFMLLRMSTRVVRLVSWGWDDTTISIAWMLEASFFASAVVEAKLGVGRPYWSLESWQIEASFIIFFAFQGVYNITIGTVRMSICFFYMRIFQSPGFQRVMWATHAFNILTVVVFFIVGMFQCQPLSHYWKGWDGEHQGTCFNFRAFAYGHAAVNMAIDVWMLILPGTQVWRLNMSLKRKMGVTLMFGCGFLLTGISITRLTYLVDFARNWTKSTDFQGYYNAAAWTSVELTAGIVVACLPASRIIVALYLSKLMEATGLSKANKGGVPTWVQKKNKGSGRPSGKRAPKFWISTLSTLSSMGGSMATTVVGTQPDSTRPGDAAAVQGIHRRAGESDLELVTITSTPETDAVSQFSRQQSRGGEEQGVSERV